MPTYEEELLRCRSWIVRTLRLALLGKRVIARGADNIPADGPAVLISNHCGAFLDPFAVYKVSPRPIFFNANRMLFNREELDFLIRKNLRRYLGSFGIALGRILSPAKMLLVRFVSGNISRFGTIPVDMYDRSKRDAVERSMAYLRQGRALVSMQGRGRVLREERNPYVKAFGRGIPYIAYRLKIEDGLDVPVVPIAIFGAHRPWGIPGRILVNIGKSLFVGDHPGETADEAVERFRRVLQTAVEKLFFESIRIHYSSSRGKRGS